MSKQWVIMGVALIALAGVSVYFLTNNTGESNNQTPLITPQPEASTEVEAERKLVYGVSTALEDVAGSGSSGQATASYFDDGSYELLVEFQNLAPTTNGDFYEGWLVNQAQATFFSTGAVEINAAGEVINLYASSVDHQSEGYTFYVLTLEPDDGDPAPAKHILEGNLESTN